MARWGGWGFGLFGEEEGAVVLEKLGCLGEGDVGIGVEMLVVGDACLDVEGEGCEGVGAKVTEYGENLGRSRGNGGGNFGRNRRNGGKTGRLDTAIRNGTKTDG